MTKSTIVWIHKSGNDWICPALEVGSSEFYKHEDKYNVLNWGEWQADLYQKATGRVKFPALSGTDEIARNIRVVLGEKAVVRLKLTPNRQSSYLMNVYNIRFVPVKERGENYGIYFGFVFKNGEFASVCTQLVNRSYSSPTQTTMSWSNSNVLKYKREFHYPENPFMKGEKSQDASLSPTIPDLSKTGISAKKLNTSFRDLYQTYYTGETRWALDGSNSGRMIIDDPSPAIAPDNSTLERLRERMRQYTAIEIMDDPFDDDMESDNDDDT